MTESSTNPNDAVDDKSSDASVPAGSSDAWREALAWLEPHERWKLDRLLRGRPPIPFCPHRPWPRQQEFLDVEALEALYGGAAGGGKSEALLMAALEYADVPGYSAILFRRTYSDLALPMALMDRARQWLAGSAAHWNETTKTWTFPSRATLAFGYLDAPNDKYRYQSAEFQFIGFDELTQFREAEYAYLFSRLRRRRDLPVPLRMRAASNPGGVGHDWVRARFLDHSSANCVFIPAKLADNPALDAAEYVEALGRLDPLTRRQLLDGDWDAHDDGLLSYELILDAQCDCLWPGGRLPDAMRRELFLGIDVGRSRDRTVVWTWERLGDVYWTREVLVLADTPYAVQRDAIRARLSNRDLIRAQMDRGGIGSEMAEDLQREFPAILEAVQLTSTRQGQLAALMRTAFREHRVRIPDDAAIRDDFRLVRQLGDRNGLPIVRTERQEGLGHADRFWAAALGFEAARGVPPRTPVALPRSIPSIHSSGASLIRGPFR